MIHSPTAPVPFADLRVKLGLERPAWNARADVALVDPTFKVSALIVFTAPKLTLAE
jgi:hypothetical protein